MRRLQGDDSGQSSTLATGSKQSPEPPPRSPGAARAEISATPGEFSRGGAASTAFFISPRDDLAGLFLTQVRPAYRQVRRELRAMVYAALSD